MGWPGGSHLLWAALIFYGEVMGGSDPPPRPPIFQTLVVASQTWDAAAGGGGGRGRQAAALGSLEAVLVLCSFPPFPQVQAVQSLRREWGMGLCLPAFYGWAAQECPCHGKDF